MIIQWALKKIPKIHNYVTFDNFEGIYQMFYKIFIYLSQLLGIATSIDCIFGKNGAY